MVADLFDVIMLNRYYGWYVNTGDLAAAERARSRAQRLGGQARQADNHDRVRRRYLPAQHSVIPAPWTEEYQAELLAMSHRVFDRVDAVVGEQVWNFATSPPHQG